LRLFRLFRCFLCRLIISFLHLFLSYTLWERLFRLLLIPKLVALFLWQSSCQLQVDVGQSHHWTVVVLECQRVDPFLVVESHLNFDRFRCLDLKRFHFILGSFLVLEKPQERRYSHSHGFERAVPISDCISNTRLVSCCEPDFLNRCVVQT
jgi:hypothetical protein